MAFKDRTERIAAARLPVPPTVRSVVANDPIAPAPRKSEERGHEKPITITFEVGDERVQVIGWPDPHRSWRIVVGPAGTGGVLGPPDA